MTRIENPTGPDVMTIFSLLQMGDDKRRFGCVDLASLMELLRASGGMALFSMRRRTLLDNDIQGLGFSDLSALEVVFSPATVCNTVMPSGCATVVLNAAEHSSQIAILFDQAATHVDDSRDFFVTFGAMGHLSYVSHHDESWISTSLTTNTSLRFTKRAEP